MDKIKRSYFDFDGGRAEPTRIAMTIAGIDFEDCRISFSEFGEMRAGTPLNSIPIVKINGVAYAQSYAMNRYFGKLIGRQLYTVVPAIHGQGLVHPQSRYYRRPGARGCGQHRTQIPTRPDTGLAASTTGTGRMVVP